MSTSRREFVQLSMAAGAGAALGAFPTSLLAQVTGRGAAGRPLEILILGGTRFLGPALVEAARARGHTVTLFNRGRSNADMFPDLETLYGDRDPTKADEHFIDQDKEPRWGEGQGLRSIAQQVEGGRTWDAVIDTSGFFPRIVKASATLLAPAVGHYTFISSVSVYSSMSEAGQDETAPLGTMEDPTLETMGDQFQYYGPLKALCEQAATDATGGAAANVRPGLIVGPRDGTDRFTYWPVRVSKGGEVLAPGTPDDPVQIIDVRDLAEFCVHLAEQRTTGAFNALGPAPGELTIGKVLESCKRVSQSNASFTWASAEFLQENNVAPWGHMPVWVPPEGEMIGFHQWNISRSIAAGLRFREIDQTTSATLDWWRTLPEERRTGRLRAGITLDRERELLALLHSQVESR